MLLKDAIEKAKIKLGTRYFDGLDISYNLSNDKNELIVTRDNGKVYVVYGELASLFRGLTLIKEHANEQEYSISIKKRFNTNGFMADCSRNGVLKISKLKEIILIQALMGQNRLLLYTEDTYKLDKYPFFGYFRGGYSKEDIKEVVEYGESFGVELIPCIQTLGHLTRPLHWDPMIPLRDGSSTLLVGEEKVYEFINEMLKFCRECFKSTEIHIGMDESTEMGLGRYLGKHPYTDRVKLFSEHLAKVISMCKEYDFVPMIWSDMYFRLNSNNEEYYRDTPLPESTLKLIPQDIELVYWDYYHSEKKIYDDMFEYHNQTNRPVIFAGGSWRWKGYVPSIQGSFRNSVPALESCLSNNCKSVFFTAWGDNGNECPMFTFLPIMALYSSVDYFDSYEDETIDSLLKAVTGETLERMKLLDLPDMPAKKSLLPQYNPSKFFLYQDPLNGIFDLQVKEDFAKNYKDFAGILAKASKESESYSYIYDLLSKLCDVLSYKVDLGVRLRKFYKDDNKAALKEIADKEIDIILNKLEIFRQAVRLEWNIENRPFGYEVLDGRLGFLANRIESVKVVLNDYLSNKINKIDELEVEVLPYNGYDYEICWNWWATTVTTNNL